MHKSKNRIESKFTDRNYSFFDHTALKLSSIFLLVRRFRCALNPKYCFKNTDLLNSAQTDKKVQTSKLTIVASKLTSTPERLKTAELNRREWRKSRPQREWELWSEECLYLAGNCIFFL